jgi:hypothetical protein
LDEGVDKFFSDMRGIARYIRGATPLRKLFVLENARGSLPSFIKKVEKWV